MDGRIRKILSILQIPILVRNLIYVSKMDDAGVRKMFEKEVCMMVQGEMVLPRGVWIGTLYNMLGTIISDGCNYSIVLEIGFEEVKTPTISREKTTLCIKDWGISERRDFKYYTIKVWLKVCMIYLSTFISMNIDYMGRRIM
jgi:hypothetical protein